MVNEGRREFGRQYWNLPMNANNDARRSLMQKHGSPFAFAKACANALGEISVDEAKAAIAKYLKQWKEAK